MKITSTGIQTLAACGLLIPLAVQAQGTPSTPEPPATTAPPAPDEGKDEQDGGPRALEEVIITGTRIMSGGFNAPTPTSVITADQLTANAQPNIFTTVAQLPSLQGSTGTATNTFSTSSGQQGLSSFSLRGLGPIRTLTLLDGQRVVGANVTGVPDVSLFPQLLIERVDVLGVGHDLGLDHLLHLVGHAGHGVDDLVAHGADEPRRRTRALLDRGGPRRHVGLAQVVHRHRAPAAGAMSAGGGVTVGSHKTVMLLSRTRQMPRLRVPERPLAGEGPSLRMEPQCPGNRY